jgi:hypothetical protein
MSFREVVMAMQGFNNHLQSQHEIEWERIRWQTTCLLNVYTEKGKSLKPTDLIQFAWENPTKKESKRSLTNNDKSIFDKWDKEA